MDIQQQTPSSQTSLKQQVFITQAEIDSIVARAVQQATQETAALFTRKLEEMEERHQQQIQELEDQSRIAERQINKLEQYSRRSHLRIWGLKVQQGQNCKNAVASFVRQLKGSNGMPIKCQETDIDAAHPLPSRSSRSREDTGSSSARSTPCIIVRFHQRELRDNVIRARRQLKGKDRIAIQEDLTSKNHQLLQKLAKKEYVESALSWEGKVYAKLKDHNQARRFDIHDL